MKAYLARRRVPSPRLAVDLFPFLGVIVTVTGIVTLLVCGLAAGGSIRQSNTAEARRLRDLIALAERHAAVAARTAASGVPASGENAGRPLAEVQAELAAALADIATFTREISLLTSRLGEARTAAADSAGTVSVPLFPADRGHRPTFVECHAAGLTVYTTAGGNVRETPVPFERIAADPGLQRELGRVAQAAQRGESVVINLLVRPDGIKAYDQTLPLIRKDKAPYSSVPITAQGRIRFRTTTTASAASP
jgi:hypothetical protein